MFRPNNSIKFLSCLIYIFWIKKIVENTFSNIVAKHLPYFSKLLHIIVFIGGYFSIIAIHHIKFYYNKVKVYSTAFNNTVVDLKCQFKGEIATHKQFCFTYIQLF